jgi:formamidopyrimidine-DNA glycosylase
MPELPEVEVLVRHLGPLLKGKTIRAVEVRRPGILEPTSPERFRRSLRHATFTEVSRRGKYLLFHLRSEARTRKKRSFVLLGHLGMTGRMYLSPHKAELPKHTPVIIDLGNERFVFEDTRYFGRLTLDTSALEQLGPEPLHEEFTVELLTKLLARSVQPIKVKLLDQSLIAGVGNIYASEALFRSGIWPGTPARALTPVQVKKLWRSIRRVLTEAIKSGSTVPLNFSGEGKRDGLLYFGRNADTPKSYEERLRVYDREGKPCVSCGDPVSRIVQAARSTFYCMHCQAEP